ncbi:putative acetyltransferase [Chitinivorax tropicus]|uniref:Putative acetyltransferase n=1 Tax=Chitinivorax tropicus TaxID=714531 RepID=A0A840MI52_9PROT|nr:GNAT family N-acetyltransferase [Chitinivorax tropicus]MBB5018328.1 putative acetyltransferase [Chitinivorax tropicus]
MSAVVIRRATVEDAPAVARIFEDQAAVAGTMQVPWPQADNWRKRLLDQSVDQVELVAMVDGGVVGIAGIRCESKLRRRHVGYIWMAIADRWQGKGVGSCMMAELIDLADSWFNLTRLELTVYTDNVAAVALYRKFGFVIEGEHVQHAFRNGEFVNSYCMARLRPVAEMSHA